MDQRHVSDLQGVLRDMVFLTFLVETAGGLCLAVLLHPFVGDWGKAFYFGLFHAVSAFCNAGFSLFPDNLRRFSHHPAITLVIAVLVILGGLGFAVLGGLVRYLRKRHLPGQDALHMRLVLITTGLLLVGGTLLIFFLEYPGALSGLSFGAKLLLSFFHAVTPRTAGFNVLDISLFSLPTILFVMFLMFVGASPGSTGGGIKTTTLTLVFLTVKSMLWGRQDVEVFGRRIPGETLMRAIAVALLSGAFVFSLFFLLLMTETLPFGDLLFEAISAFGTVGLSLGATTKLTGAGKIFIILLMYMGRIGPLTFASIVPSERHEERYRFPSGWVMVG